MLLVVDTGPLTHFAQARILPLLARILGSAGCVYPPQVGKELDRGPHRLINQQVLTSRWLSCMPLPEEAVGRIPEIIDALGGTGGTGDRNLGEAECIALADVVEGMVYLDDGDGVSVANRVGVEYRTTLELLDDAMTRGRVTASESVAAIDALLSTGYWLPVKSGAAFLRALGR